MTVYSMFRDIVKWIASKFRERKEKIDYIQDLIADLENNYNKLKVPKDRPNYKIRKLELQRKFLDYFSFRALKNINDDIDVLHEDIDRLLNVIRPSGDRINTDALQEQMVHQREKLKGLTKWIIGVLSEKYKIPTKIS